ncbi:MAG: polysaccharide biosynthesis protein [Nitrospiraceae bacterium]|nr:polysaccharide biosynthesis protein [Nitrospiraceae bacterium]
MRAEKPFGRGRALPPRLRGIGRQAGAMGKFFRGSKVLLTGSAGTIGSELARQLHAFGPSELRLMDNNETDLFMQMEGFKNNGAHCFLGDVRDSEKLCKLAEGADVIIHCAAFKHVILSEYNPFDVAQTNIFGVENVIRAAKSGGVKRVLFTSSDKAVNPTNVMGTSKLMGERLITAANALKNGKGAVMSSSRFGNVIGSRGSVVPLFMKQIRGGGPVTLTDRRMTRFVMTIGEAARLVLKAVCLSRGGEVFVTKMPVARISDLAEVMVEILAPRLGRKPPEIEIVETGVKPGEKLYEELMSQEEVSRSLELKDMFVVTPAFKSIYHSIDYSYDDIVSAGLKRSYVSAMERPMTKAALKRYILENRVLEAMEGEPPAGGRA